MFLVLLFGRGEGAGYWCFAEFTGRMGIKYFPSHFNFWLTFIFFFCGGIRKSQHGFCLLSLLFFFSPRMPINRKPHPAKPDQTSSRSGARPGRIVWTFFHELRIFCRATIFTTTLYTTPKRIMIATTTTITPPPSVVFNMWMVFVCKCPCPYMCVKS